MARISVSPAVETTYRVIVEDEDGRTAHDVTLEAGTIARYAPGIPAAQLIEASFDFLLEREPKESILTRFDLTVIERYFPEYPQAIREALKLS